MRLVKTTPIIGAEIQGLDFSQPLSADLLDEIYAALIDNLVIFIRSADISPQQQIAFAQSFGALDEPHLHYPHVADFERIVLLENDADRPPDTNSWHTDLTFKQERPFASVLIARQVPEVGGDTLWSSCYAAYDRLPTGMKTDLEGLQAVHDLGDFRNDFADENKGQSGDERLNEALCRFGHKVQPLIARHPVTQRKFLNFNEAFVSHIAGLTSNDSHALRTYLSNHMNKPEDQLRWRWQAGDLAMWDNRVTMHYAVADYMPQYRAMNRVTITKDRRV